MLAKGRVKTICAWCSEPIEVVRSRFDRQNGRVGCSRECGAQLLWETRGRTRKEVVCVICGEKAFRHKKAEAAIGFHCKGCAPEFFTRFRKREKHPRWKGGLKIDKDGYRLLWRPAHREANSQGYVREHRLVAEESLGRSLLSSEVVHHKNRDPSDNRPENLEVLADLQHRRLHATGRTPLLNKARSREVARLYSKGDVSIAALAKEFRVGCGAVRSALIREGVPFRKKWKLNVE